MLPTLDYNQIIFQRSLAHEGWLVGAMVLGKLPVPGRPTNLD